MGTSWFKAGLYFTLSHLQDTRPCQVHEGNPQPVFQSKCYEYPKHNRFTRPSPYKACWSSQKFTGWDWETSIKTDPWAWFKGSRFEPNQCQCVLCPWARCFIYSSGADRAFPGGWAAHPEDQNEREDEENLRKNERKWGKILPTRGWEASYGPILFPIALLDPDANANLSWWCWNLPQLHHHHTCFITDTHFDSTKESLTSLLSLSHHIKNHKFTFSTW